MVYRVVSKDRCDYYDEYCIAQDPQEAVDYVREKHDDNRGILEIREVSLVLVEGWI